MLIQVTKYAVLIYISFSILNGNKKSSTPTFPDIESDKRFFQISACSGQCLTDNSNSTMTFDSCYNLCNKTVEQEHIKVPIKKIYENYSLNLVCREERSLVFTVKQKHRQLTPILNYTKSEETSKNIFMININKAFNADSAIVYLSNTSIFTISNLHPNTTYNISIAIVHSDYKYSIVTRDEQFTTLTRRYKPKEIQSIKLEKFDIEDNDDKMHLKLIVSWKPGSDMVCQYVILCHPSINQDLTHAPIREPEALYTHTVKQLLFGTLYHIGIRAINSNDPSSESDFLWKEFMTPTCLKWYDHNLTICPPNKPEGLFIEETQLSNQMFALNVTWDPPELYPDYYILRILDLDELSTGAVTFTINKTENFVYIPNILINGSNYEVHLTAYSGGGNSSTVIDRSIEKKIIIDSDNFFILTASIITPIIGIGIMLLVVIIFCHRREKLKRYQQRCRYFEELEKKAPADPKSSLNFATKTLPMLPSVETLNHFQLDLEEKLFFDDDMEIERGSVQVFEILGEGAFGLVRRGIFKIKPNEEKDVAVKMLKDRPNIDDVRAFRREIEVMKSVGRHPNIVGILGHYTKDTNDLLLITEYCSKGNLLNFLRNEWQFLYKQTEHSYHSSNTPKIETSDEKQCENAFNFDISLIDKDPTKKYKSIEREMEFNENPSNNDIIMNNNKAPIPKLIAFNKSYGYNQLCNSSCKCQVDILSSIVSSDENTPNNSNIPRLPLINVHNCDCHKQNARTPLSVENRGYYRNFANCKEKSTTTEDEVIRHPLSTADLFMIAKQIALGMEFLSKNKVVHRDLAARNVLVCQDRTVKIADFGLSRDVYQENVYKKTGSGKLPIKWLALESLTHQVYTTQSDVWSFGILLYEIATLGGIPYPTIKTNRLMQLLKTGYRMEKPDNCNQSLYDLMLSCWHVNPNDRPNFSEICQLLDDMMYELPDNSTADNLLTENLKNCKNLDDETYLKPI